MVSRLIWEGCRHSCAAANKVLICVSVMVITACFLVWLERRVCLISQRCDRNKKDDKVFSSKS